MKSDLYIKRKSGAMFVTVMLLVMFVSVSAVFIAMMSRAQSYRFSHVQNYLIQFPFLPLTQAYAVELIQDDAATSHWKDIDFKGALGVALQENKDVHSFQIDDMIVKYGFYDEDQKWIPGFLDEDSKLNINAIDFGNKHFLVHLLEYLEFNEQQIDDIVLSVVDWKDSDLLSSHEQERLESEYYSAQKPPILPMNQPFSTMNELRLVRGFDQENFLKLKSYLTIFPKDKKEIKINFLTASTPVLYAIIKSLPAISTSDAKFMAEDFVRLRELYFTDYNEAISVSIDNIIGISNWSARHQLLIQSAFTQYGKLTSSWIVIPLSLKANENNVPIRVIYLYDREKEEIVDQSML